MNIGAALVDLAEITLACVPAFFVLFGLEKLADKIWELSNSEKIREALEARLAQSKETKK